METPRLDLIRLPSILARSALVAGFAGALLTAACGGGSDGTGNAGSSGGGTTGGSAAGTSGGGGAAGTGVAGSTGVAGTGVAGSNAAGSGGSSSGVAGTGGSTAGTTGSAGSTAGSTGSGGTTAGTGSGNAGRGGSAGGAAGQTGSAGRGGSGGGTAGTGTAGTGGPATCPANATFCSGFETNALPTGATYNHNGAPGEWTRDFAIDNTQKNSGNSSLRVKSMAEGGTTGQYRMLAAPATMNAFWARFFVRSNMPMGGSHNIFAMGAINDQANKEMTVEFAEDVGIAFNASDAVRWPDGYGRLQSGQTNPYMLPANAWHCVEISFDGTNRVQQLYVNGAQLINVANYPAASLAFRFFKFGFMQLSGPDRLMWFDDVVVAPTRVGGCP